ncbi:MAG TPA: glycosyltransferase [Candidatus Angelobacter sp.]|nr:glycosyltransferase [Candidatus Angelobacter sp.]
MGDATTRPATVGVELGVFALVLGVCLLALRVDFGYDGQMMYRVTESLALRHSFVVQDPVWHSNEPYAYFGLGVSLLLLPFFGLGSLLAGDGSRFIVLYGPLVTALTAWVLLRLLRELGASLSRAVVIALTFAFGTLAWHYSTSIFSEPLVGLGITAAIYWLHRYQRDARGRWLLAAGSATAITLLARFDSLVLVVAPVALYAVFLVVRARPLSRDRLAALFDFGAPVGAALAVNLWYDWLRYGSVFTVGSSKALEGGFSTPLWTGLYGLLLSPGDGLLVYVPVLLASAVSLRGFIRHARPTGLLLLSLLAVRLLFYARWSFWDGRDWGPRFLIPLLPVLLLPLICLPARRWLRVGAAALAAVGIGVELLGQLVPYDTIVWPRTAPLVVSTLQLHDSAGSTCLCSWVVDQAASEAMDFDLRFAPLTRQVNLLLHGTVDPSWSAAWPLRALLLALAAAFAIFLVRSARRAGQVPASAARQQQPLTLAAVATRMDASLGVIVPVYNEAATLERVLDRVLAQREVHMVVVVDDGSTDGSFEVAGRFSGDGRVTVCRHPENRGKGAAVRTGLARLSTSIVIIQDADLEYDPAEYAVMVAPINSGRSDVVYGVRGFLSHTSYSYWFVVGNRLVTTATNMLFNCYIQDMESGFKAMRVDLMRQLGLKGDRFDIEPEITGRVLRLGYRIHEVPITYYARGRGEGKKLTWRDGVIALLTLVRIRLTPRSWLFGEDTRYHAARLRALAAISRFPDVSSERAS